MKRMLAAVLMLALALSLAAVPALAAPEDVQYDFEETVLVDNDDIKVTVAEFEFQEDGDPTFSMLFENNIDQDLRFSVMDSYLDGRKCEGYGSEDVAAGKKAYCTLYWYAEDMEASGVNYINDVTVELCVRTTGDGDSETLFRDLVSWSVNAVSDTPVLADLTFDSGFEEVPVLSGDYTAVVKNFDPDGPWDDGEPSLVIYLENNTDEDVYFSAENVSVNGFMCDPYWGSEVAAGTSVYDYYFYWPESYLEEAHIESFENVEFDLSVVSAETYDEIAREPVTVNLTGLGTAAAGDEEEPAEEVTDEEAAMDADKAAALAADEAAALAADEAAAEEEAALAEEEAAALAEEGLTEEPAEEAPAEAGEIPGLAGSMDLESFVYTNDVFGMSCAVGDGWYVISDEGVAENADWTEDSGMEPTAYLDQYLADGGTAVVMHGGLDDPSQSIYISVTSLNGAGTMTDGDDAATKMSLAFMMNGDSALAAMGISDGIAMPGPVIIGGQEHVGVRIEYDQVDEETGETIPSHIHQAYLVYNDEAADRCYLMTIQMRFTGEDTETDIGSFFTMPDVPDTSDTD